MLMAEKEFTEMKKREFTQVNMYIKIQRTSLTWDSSYPCRPVAQYQYESDKIGWDDWYAIGWFDAMQWIARTDKTHGPCRWEIGARYGPSQCHISVAWVEE